MEKKIIPKKKTLFKRLKSEWECRNCGRCCNLFKLEAKNKEELIKTFEESYGFSLKSYDIQVLFTGECEHRKDNKCAIYSDQSKVSCGNKNKDYFCKRYNANKVQDTQVYEKRCRACEVVRRFQKGTERDKQAVCGNCWVW